MVANHQGVRPGLATLLFVSRPDRRLQERFAAVVSTWRVEYVSDGCEAQQRLERGAPSMLLADSELTLPGPNGFELCRQLRAASSASCAVLFLPRPSIEARLRAFESGADDCLEEPFDVRELAARANALARRCAFTLPFSAEWQRSYPAAPGPEAEQARPQVGSGTESWSGKRVDELAMHRRAAALGQRFGLSPREMQIVALVAGGVELKAIGPRVGCAYSSVRTHLRRTARKLGCSTTREILIRLFSAQLP